MIDGIETFEVGPALVVHEMPGVTTMAIACAYARGAWFAFFEATPNAFYPDEQSTLLACWKLYGRWVKWSGADG